MNLGTLESFWQWKALNLTVEKKMQQKEIIFKYMEQWMNTINNQTVLLKKNGIE